MRSGKLNMVNQKMPLLRREILPDSAGYTEKIVQFGTGAFLKGFIGWIIQQYNDRSGLDAGIVAVKLRAGNEQQIEAVNAQDGLFTVNVRGIVDGNLEDKFDLVRCQNRAISPYQDYVGFEDLAMSPALEWVISNSTESGIVFSAKDRFEDSPPETFPAKLTILLFHRFQYFMGDPQRGIKVLCCELIEDNASTLKNLIIQYAKAWHLDPAFIDWLNQSCRFYNTLVDRIVTGKPTDPLRSVEINQQLGYIDNELVETESYYLWVIENGGELESYFPRSAGLNVVFTDSLRLYRQRKVRILNGAHSGTVALARLMGVETVYEAMQNRLLKSFMHKLVFDEVCPTIDMPAGDVRAYAESIMERFCNPYLKHEWKNISLNSLSKWTARVLPTLQDATRGIKRNPIAMVTSLAALLLLYRGSYGDRKFEIQDNLEHIAVIKNAWEENVEPENVTAKVLSDTRIWGQDLSVFNKAVSTALSGMMELGIENWLGQILTDKQ